MDLAVLSIPYELWLERNHPWVHRALPGPWGVELAVAQAFQGWSVWGKPCWVWRHVQHHVGGR